MIDCGDPVLVIRPFIVTSGSVEQDIACFIQSIGLFFKARDAYGAGTPLWLTP